MAEPIDAELGESLDHFMRVMEEAFPGQSITLLLADRGANPNRRMSYISNCQRQDMTRVMREFIAKWEREAGYAQ